jgi:glycosyltransferase involved in cell wall biosynthesis
LVGGQPNKRVGDAVKALAELRNRGRSIPKLYVVAHHFVPWYKEWLVNLAYKLGLQQYVYFMENLSEQDLLNPYASAKIVLSTAHFEPFGMSVAEGMTLRAVPIVYKGSLSGPWIDIVDRGRYGMGFKTIEELPTAIEYVITADKIELLELQERAYIGSRRFSLKVFRESLIKLLEN